MLVTDDDKLSDFFTKFLHQLSNWLLKGEVQKLVLVITGIETQEVLERWAFEVHADDSTSESGSAPIFKPQKEIMAEIQAIIRQITASVSFLPILEEQCAFDLLVYTDKNSDVPALWEESDPRFIKDSAEVRLRSFSTKVRNVFQVQCVRLLICVTFYGQVHKVDAMVAYCFLSFCSKRIKMVSMSFKKASLLKYPSLSKKRPTYSSSFRSFASA